MRSIIDIGQQGSEHLPVFYRPQAVGVSLTDLALQHRLAIIQCFPIQTIEAEVADGVRKTVELRTLQLNNTKIFSLMHGLAPYELMLYAQKGQRLVMGMLSPNYSTDGTERLPSIKVIPLKTPYPLTARLEPDARMATMLAGAVSAERQGTGGHEGELADDFEHKATILGAISVGRPELAIGHKNHEVRGGILHPTTGRVSTGPSSIATGLTNGRLGNLYAPQTELGEFTGYGEPMIFDPSETTEHDKLYVPASFLGSEGSFGLHYGEASRIMLGAGMQALHLRRGGNLATVNEQIRAIGGRL